MADDLVVKFGGDTSGLNEAIAQARQAQSQFTQATGQTKVSMDQLTAAFGASKVAADVATASWRENLASLADLTIVVRGAFDALSFIIKETFQIAGDDIGAVAQVAKDDIGAVAEAIKTTSSLSWRGQGLVIQGEIAATAAAYNNVLRPAIEATSAAAREFAQANGFLLASTADSSTIMAVAESGGLRAVQDQVAQANAAIQAQMQAVRDSGGSDYRTSALSDAPDDGSADDGAAAIEELEGKIKSVDDTLKGFVSDLQQIPDTTKDVADGIEAAFTAVPGYTLEANDAFVQLLQSIASNGDEAQDFSKKLVAAFADAKAGGIQLAALVSKAGDDAEKQLSIAKGLAGLLPQGQTVAFFDAVRTGVERQRDGLQAIQDDYEAQEAKLNVIGQLWEKISGTTRQEAALRLGSIAELDDEVNSLREQSAVWTDIIAKTKAQHDLIAAIKADTTTPTAVIAASQANLKALQPGTAMQTQSNPGAMPTDDEKELLIRTLIGEAGNQGADGMAAVASVIKNRVETAFDGLKTYEDIITEHRGDQYQFDVWKPGNAAGDMAMSQSTDSAVYKQAETIIDQLLAGKLADPTNGATSYYAKNAPGAFPMSNTTTIKDQIFGNTPGSPQVLDNKSYQERTELIQAANQRIAEQQALLAGGTAVQQEQLSLAQRNATATANAVTDTQQKVEAQKQYLATLGLVVDAEGKVAVADDTKATLQKRTEAMDGYYAAVRAMQDAQLARDKAVDDLGIAQLERGSKEWYAAVSARYDQEAALAKGNAAVLAGIDQQRFDALKVFNQKQVADAKTTADLTAAAQAAANGQDAQAAAQKRLDTAKQALTATGQSVGASGTVQTDSYSSAVSDEARTSAAKEYYAALDALRSADVAKDVAAIDLKLASTKKGSQEELDLETQKAQLQQSLYAQGSAQYIGYQTQIVEAQKRFNQQAASEAAQTATTTYENAKKGLDDQLAAVRDAESQKSLSSLQALDQTRSIRDQETALERQYLENMIKIWAQFPQEYKKYTQQLALLDAQRHSEGLKDEQKYADSIASSWKSSLEEVGSTISSTLLQMEQHSATLRDLLKNVALNIEGQFLNAGIRMVADWAANQTKDVAIAIASQAQITSAVAEGTAARAALSATSGLGNIFGDVLGGIAGIFTGGGSSALGSIGSFFSSMPSLDVGAWHLPSDTVAQLHRGEMVVPSGPAELFRQAMSGGGGGGGGAIVNNHHHTWNVQVAPQPRHPTAVVDEIARNAAAIGRALNTAPKGK